MQHVVNPCIAYSVDLNHGLAGFVKAEPVEVVKLMNEAMVGETISRIKDSMSGAWVTEQKRLKLYGLSLEICKLQPDIDVLLLHEEH